VFCVIWMLSSVSAADVAGLPIFQGVSFKMVRIPIYDHFTSKPVLFLEINKIDIQGRRFDFLTLPSVPQVVFHSVKIIFLSDEALTLGLKALSDFSRENLQFQTGIMEEVTLMDSSEKILLTANQGSMSRSGVALMLRDVSLNAEKQEIIKEGRLELIGPDSGKLFWVHAGKRFVRNALAAD
jgi:hypothetical protein